jgi:hypothetical protein
MKKINLFTQNSDLRKTGIWGWTLPAHIVTLTDGTHFNTCPNAGICAKFCYAKNGTYMFSNVKKAHIEKLELVLNHRDLWIEMMLEELKKKKYDGKYIRVHDAGDFFSVDYTTDWFKIINANKNIIFYAYTKEVLLFKETLKDQVPENFILIYSFGGRQDNHIDREVDRHSDVFPDYDEMIAHGYNDIAEDDKQAAINPNHKVGLYRNNIKHFIKKMGDKKFSDFKRTENNLENKQVKKDKQLKIF